MRLKLPLALAALAFATSLAARADDAPSLRLAKDKLPRGWSIDREDEQPAATVRAIEKKLGGKIASVVNQSLSLPGGMRATLNVVTCASEKDAEAVEASMPKFHGGDAEFVARRGREVAEVAGMERRIAQRVLGAAGIEREARTEIAFRVACVDQCEYMQGNPVFEQFPAWARNHGDPAIAAKISELTKGWKFGKTIRLARGVEWRTTPEPKTRDERGVAVVLGFGDVPSVAGVPCVDVAATIATRDRWTPSPGEASSASRAASAFFPSDAPAMRETAAQLTVGMSDDLGRVLAIQRFVGTQIEYRGPQGTRWGAAKVLEQRFGRCWDKSDLFITLCRSAGIAARQVAGWLLPEQTGHVWAEVHVGGGWLPIDPTAPWTGVSRDYIPLFETEDGEMPIVHTAMPKVRALPAR